MVLYSLSLRIRDTDVVHTQLNMLSFFLMRHWKVVHACLCVSPTLLTIRSISLYHDILIIPTIQYSSNRFESIAFDFHKPKCVNWYKRVKGSNSSMPLYTQLQTSIFFRVKWLPSDPLFLKYTPFVSILHLISANMHDFLLMQQVCNQRQRTLLFRVSCRSQQVLERGCMPFWVTCQNI